MSVKESRRDIGEPESGWFKYNDMTFNSPESDALARRIALTLKEAGFEPDISLRSEDQKLIVLDYDDIKFSWTIAHAVGLYRDFPSREDDRFPNQKVHYIASERTRGALEALGVQYHVIADDLKKWWDRREEEGDSLGIFVINLATREVRSF
jgi:hypothetical protein